MHRAYLGTRCILTMTTLDWHGEAVITNDIQPRKNRYGNRSYCSLYPVMAVMYCKAGQLTSLAANASIRFGND
ncbi:hypothetical protein D1872_271060 [compost metagenome]